MLVVFAAFAAACGGGDGGASVTADAGEDFSVEVGEIPAFDGCGSEGEISNFAWTIVEAPDGQADSADKALREQLSVCSFELESAMVLDDVGSWTIELAVTDGEETATDQVVVEVNG